MEIKKSFFKIYMTGSSFIVFVSIFVIVVSMFCLNNNNNNNNSFAIESTTTNNKNGFNIIAVADVGCSLRAQENIKNIDKLDPELFLVAGDLSYEKTPDCWFNMTKSLDSKTKIAIGNHDDYEEEGSKGSKLKQSYMDHYGLNKSYYSFDYQNVHVLVLDTQLELSVDTLESTAVVNETTTTYTTKKDLDDNTKETKNNNESKDKKKEPFHKLYPLVNLEDFLNQKSIDIEIPQLDELKESNAKVPALDTDNEQYQFVLNDLERTSQNESIEWIFVMFHKTMYSSLSKQLEEYIIRDKYHEIFDYYNVDLVIQGHNHIYSRTLPLTFNEQQVSDPIIDQNNANTNNNDIFTNPKGTIFLVVGTGGDELYKIKEKQYYVANQYDQGFGFVDLKIDGKRLDGTFYDINLLCQMKITEKEKKLVRDFESCIPPVAGNDQLKVIDQFTIIK